MGSFEIDNLGSEGLGSLPILTEAYIEELKDPFEFFCKGFEFTCLGGSGFRFLLRERWKLCNSLLVDLDRSVCIEDLDRFPLNI